MARLIGIDGTDFGVLYQTKPDPLGNTTAITLKHKFIEKYYVNDPKYGYQLIKRLLEKKSLDPDSLNVLVALVRRNIEQVTMPPGSVLNVSTDNPDAIIITVDGKGNPVPLEALLTRSPTERDRLSKLFKYYSAFVYYVYPKMVREIDMYRQVVKYQQQLLNTRDYEVNTLLEANTRIQQVLNNAYSTITDLAGQITMLEQILQLSSMEADKWREASQNAVKLLPTITTLLHTLAEEISRGMTLTMQRHASELSRSEALETTVNTLLSKINELEKEYMEHVTQVTKNLHLPSPPPTAPVKGGENVGGSEESSGGTEGGTEASE